MKKIHRPGPQGFTLIELVVMISLIGILSTMAIPRYTEFKANTAAAATKSVACALASAFALSYAAAQVANAVSVLRRIQG